MHPAVVLHSVPEHERTVLHRSRNPLAAFDALVGSRDPLTGCLDRSNLERLGARLAADGLTNSRIAEHLFVSPRTVQSHLVRVFAKLGITRRTELVVIVQRHPG